MSDINLLPTEERSARNFEAARGKLTLVSTMFLVATALFTLGTLGFFVTLTNQRNQLLSQIEDASGRINSLKSTEELVVVTKGKAATASKILSARTNFSSFFEKFSSLVPGGVYFSDIRFSASKISFVGKARTSADVAGLVSALVLPGGSAIVTNVSVDSLSSDETGVYAFSMSAQPVAK